MEGMEVRPSSGGAVIKLSPEALKSFMKGLKRANSTFVQLDPIIKDLTEKLVELGELIPPEVGKVEAMRLDPAFSGREESFPIRRIEEGN